MNRFSLFLAPVLLGSSILLSGCGLRPVYSGGAQGATARALGHIEVAPIQGKSGWLVRNALNDRLSALTASSADGAPHYVLNVLLNDRVTGSGVLLDETVKREQRILRARYNLVDQASGKTILDRTAVWDAGLDVATSEYSTIAAEDTALERLAQVIADQIIARISQKVIARQAIDAAGTDEAR